MTHIEIKKSTGAINVCKRNAVNGIVTRSVCIGYVETSTPEDEIHASAEEVAGDFGWVIDDQYGWSKSEDYEWVDCFAKPVSVSFVGNSVPADAVFLARSAGVETDEIFYADSYDEESGKTRVWFSVGEPKGWVWETNLPWGDWFDE
jgi:hypothetical protein